MAGEFVTCYNGRPDKYYNYDLLKKSWNPYIDSWCRSMNQEGR